MIKLTAKNGQNRQWIWIDSTNFTMDESLLFFPTHNRKKKKKNEQFPLLGLAFERPTLSLNQPKFVQTKPNFSWVILWQRFSNWLMLHWNSVRLTTSDGWIDRSCELEFRDYLRFFYFQQPQQWPKVARMDHFHSTVSMTPFQAIYGQDPSPLLQLVDEECNIKEVNMVIKKMNLILDKLKANLSKARDRMWRFSERGQRKVSFDVGDYVFPQLQPYRFPSLAFRPNKKLN